VHICESDHLDDRWPGLRGRISAAALQIVAPDLAERATFTCGPAAYMASVRQLLAETGYDMRNYHEECFSFETLLVADPAVPNGAAPPRGDLTSTLSTDGNHETACYSVEFVKSGQTVTCKADENILDAAWAAGLTPASSCGQGMCGTCKTTMLSGCVDMQHNGRIRPKEITQNKILICCSKPISDLRIDC
jgi:glycine betaine catabolism B